MRGLRGVTPLQPWRPSTLSPFPPAFDKRPPSLPDSSPSPPLPFLAPALARHIQYKAPRPKRDAHRPLRSVLFTPGSRPDKMRKALTQVPADVLAFDLEDSVSYDRKVEAREAVKEVLSEAPPVRAAPRYVTVRVNCQGSQWWTEDLAAMAGLARVHAVIIPKVQSADTLMTAHELLGRFGASPAMGIWAMVETPAAVMNIKEIARSANFVPRLEALMMGTSDLTNELHALHHPDRVPLLYSLSSCLVAARAFKLRVIDGVHLNLNDPNGFAAACAQGRALGFDGKSLIHPKTVAEANKAFGPRPDELAHAERVLTAWREAQAHGEGLAVVDGQLIEVLHAEEAYRLLTMQENIEAIEASVHAQAGMMTHPATATTSDTAH